ncbi:MAG: hypothetical protein ACM3QZ_01255 [Solirubrobacterales bacterium]
MERTVSLLQGKETAIECEWVVPWDTGAPLPHVVSNGHRNFLAYYVNDSHPRWDASLFPDTESYDEGRDLIAVVEFDWCYSFKFGGVNDETWPGHPLYNRGLDGYGAHIIKNSRWLNEEREIQASHRCFDADHWDNMKHYFLAFHDESFECIARGFNFEVTRDNMDNVTKNLQRRLFERL